MGRRSSISIGVAVLVCAATASASGHATPARHYQACADDSRLLSEAPAVTGRSPGRRCRVSRPRLGCPST